MKASNVWKVFTVFTSRKLYLESWYHLTWLMTCVFSLNMKKIDAWINHSHNHSQNVQGGITLWTFKADHVMEYDANARWSYWTRYTTLEKKGFSNALKWYLHSYCYFRPWPNIMRQNVTKPYLQDETPGTWNECLLISYVQNRTFRKWYVWSCQRRGLSKHSKNKVAVVRLNMGWVVSYLGLKGIKTRFYIDGKHMHKSLHDDRDWTNQQEESRSVGRDTTDKGIISALQIKVKCSMMSTEKCMI